MQMVCADNLTPCDLYVVIISHAKYPRISSNLQCFGPDQKVLSMNAPISCVIKSDGKGSMDMGTVHKMESLREV